MLKLYLRTCSFVSVGLGSYTGGSEILMIGGNQDNPYRIWVLLTYLLSLKRFKGAYIVI